MRPRMAGQRQHRKDRLWLGSILYQVRRLNNRHGRMRGVWEERDCRRTIQARISLTIESSLDSLYGMSAGTVS